MIHKHYEYDPMKNADKRYLGFTIAAAIGGSLATAAGGLTAAGIAIGAGITAATVGAGVYATSKIFGGSKQSGSQATAPAALPAAPSVDKATVDAQESIDKKRRATARNKTIFTSPFGLNEEDKSGLATKTLLGE